MITKNIARLGWNAVLLPFLLGALLWLASCSEDEKSSPTSPTSHSTCLDCHSNEASLRATALPDSGSGDPSGEG